LLKRDARSKLNTHFVFCQHFLNLICLFKLKKLLSDTFVTEKFIFKILMKYVKLKGSKHWQVGHYVLYDVLGMFCSLCFIYVLVEISRLLAFQELEWNIQWNRIF